MLFISSYYFRDISLQVKNHQSTKLYLSTRLKTLVFTASSIILLKWHTSNLLWIVACWILYGINTGWTRWVHLVFWLMQIIPLARSLISLINWSSPRLLLDVEASCWVELTLMRKEQKTSCWKRQRTAAKLPLKLSMALWLKWLRIAFSIMLNQSMKRKI